MFKNGVWGVLVAQKIPKSGTDQENTSIFSSGLIMRWIAQNSANFPNYGIV